MKKAIVILSLLACLSHCFNICSPIEFVDYQFDISTFSKETFGLASNTGQSGFATYFSCNLGACSDTGFNSTSSAMTFQKAYFVMVQNGQCFPLTIGGSIKENYMYIDSAQPSKGLSVNFTPYIDVVVGNTSNTETVYRAVLDVVCATSESRTCQYTQFGPYKSTHNGVNYETTTKMVTCTFNSTQGCPSLVLNDFWKFLQNNKLAFVFFLWAVYIFQYFLGYFVIRLTIFLNGIMTGALVGTIVSALNYQNFFNSTSSSGIIIFIIVLSVLMGVCFGLALLTLPKLGYVNIGLWVALQFSLLLQNSLLFLSGSMIAFYVVLGISGVLMACISLLGFRKFIIISTSFISSFGIVRTLGFLLPGYPNQILSSKLFVIDQSTSWQFYLYLVAIIILTILGCVFQFHWYRKKGNGQGNKGYYLEDDDTIKDKVKRFFRFDPIRDVINKGKDQIMFFKNLVAKGSDGTESQSDDREYRRRRKGVDRNAVDHEQIEMKQMTGAKQNKPAKTNKTPVKDYDSDEESDDGRYFRKNKQTKPRAAADRDDNIASKARTKQTGYVPERELQGSYGSARNVRAEPELELVQDSDESSEQADVKVHSVGKRNRR